MTTPVGSSQRIEIFRVGSVAAVVGWLAGLASAIVTGGIPAGVMQPSELPHARAAFLADVNQHASAALRFFGADFIFVIAYLIVFVTLFEITVVRSRPLAMIALGAGVLAALFDTFENTSFVVYALGSIQHADFTEPSVPMLYYVTNLKWTLAIVCIALFGAIFPRETSLERTLTVLMLLFPLLGAAATAEPALLAWRALFFVVGMPLFAFYFAKRFSNSS